MYCEKLDILLNYRKSSIKPPKGLFLLIKFYEGFNREGGGGANLICGETGYHTAFQTKRQWAKKVVSDSYSYSLGQVDFAIGLVNSVLNLPDGQLTFFEEFNLQKNCEINSAHQKVFWAS